MVHPIRLASVLVFLAIPILEIGVLIRVGQAIGYWQLALIVVVSAMLGSAVIHRTGLAVLAKARRQMETGTFGETNPLLEGLLMVTAGMLLIFPGLISDAIGLVLLIPAVRHVIITKFLPRVISVTPFSTDEPIHQPSNPHHSDSGPAGPFDAEFTQGKTIEGEYERLSEETVKRDHMPDRVRTQHHSRRQAR